MKAPIALAACLLAAPALAQDIQVIDGDTFELNGKVVRLWGIDAPELDQTCGGDDHDFSEVGLIAWQVLSTALQALDHCDAVDTDRYGRTVAICTMTQGFDIGALMVASGWAWEDTRLSDGAYADMTQHAEEEAGTPLYRGECVPARERRRENVRE